jgi:hypothetical protein
MKMSGGGQVGNGQCGASDTYSDDYTTISYSGWIEPLEKCCLHRMNGMEQTLVDTALRKSGNIILHISPKSFT